MSLSIIGAGFGRTGTASLKFALEKLIGAPCYHMIEVFRHPEHVALWHQASLGNMPDWEKLFEGYAAAVDFPASTFWPELMHAYPDALVLLSIRDSEEWWQSAKETILGTHDAPFITPEWLAMVKAMFARSWGGRAQDREGSIAALEANTARAKKEVPPERLLVWNPREGWEPICNVLGVPVPAEPFPRTNTREDWRAREAAVKAGKMPDFASVTPTVPGS